ncbi:MAG TPA: cyclic 2,3-diphosphoglycerate synthase [Candidatus Angelobacter sp.]|nr:cyclic 2,3-diphosphoglycerate synthase [Candidatus Angelobacter sp.]
MANQRVVIMGAAGRDFHVFNVVFRDDPEVRVVAFTATQIPGIAGRHYPSSLAGPHHPDGIPIVPEDDLEELVRREAVDTVVFAYSDVSHETVMHAASRALAAGADFALLGPDRTMLASRRPVIAVGATRTGCGKSQTTRHLAALVAEAGLVPVVVRHPMPYGDLAAQRVQRFARLEDLELQHTTIEEREEYEAHVEAGRVLYAGVDYEAILRAAEDEADVILWDGGNNDFPFYRPDLFVVVADPLRPEHEARYHPGETNVRMADVLLVNKIDSAEPGAVEREMAALRSLNPTAPILTARSALRLEGGDIAGRRVVVVEDGPTLTHGGMRFGAGIAAARRFGASTIVDPRPHAVGSLHDVLVAHPDLEPLLPAMGYGVAQMSELAESLNAVDADVVLAGTPIDLTRVLELNKPVVRVRYDLEQVSGPRLRDLIAPALERARAELVPAGA